jgi:hypothetical protein
MLSGLLPSDHPGIVDMGVCFGCYENMFTGHCLAMGVFSGPAVAVFSHHVNASHAMKSPYGNRNSCIFLLLILVHHLNIPTVSSIIFCVGDLISHGNSISNYHSVTD